MEAFHWTTIAQKIQKAGLYWRASGVKFCLEFAKRHWRLSKLVEKGSLVWWNQRRTFWPYWSMVVETTCRVISLTNTLCWLCWWTGSSCALFLPFLIICGLFKVWDTPYNQILSDIFPELCPRFVFARLLALTNSGVFQKQVSWYCL